MRNPFVYGESVTGQNFCNRKNEIRKLKRDILDGQKIFLISSRRFGKTSLIKTVMNKLNKKEIIPVFLDLEEFSSYKEFLDTYLSILIQKSAPKNKILRFIQQIISGLRIDFKMDDTGKPLISLAYAQPISGEVDSRIFSLPELIAKKQNKKVVVIFDEFQEIQNLGRKNIEGALRARIQTQRNVSYIFAGSKRHILEKMVNSPDKPFYRIGPVFHLSKMADKVFLEFISAKFKETGIKVDSVILQRLIERAENIPYYVQMFAHELWDFVLAKGGVGVDDIEQVVRQLITQYSQNFHLEWARLILSKRRLLKAIALYGGKQVLSKNYLEKNELGLPSAVHRTLLSLVEEGYLDRNGNEYFFPDILFREWIRSR